jgi:hypothetical protein
MVSEGGIMLKLPDDYFEQADKKITELTKNTKCELCGYDEWVLTSKVVLLASRDGKESKESPLMPCAALFCEHCGHLRLFHIGVLGINIEDKK